jgi:hypothetical protein
MCEPAVLRRVFAEDQHAEPRFEREDTPTSSVDLRCRLPLPCLLELTQRKCGRIG